MSSLTPGSPTKASPIKPGKAEAKQRESKARGDLVGEQGLGEKGEEERQRHPGDDRGEDAEIGRARHVSGAEAAYGAHDHHALDSKIENARAFDNRLAHTGEEQGRGGGDDGENESLKNVHGSTPPEPVRARAWRGRRRSR